ncbi:NAD(P)/FAD-dependent oxidoreductase [Desulfobacterota bacterium AH_259_B03_O07]|nr:NAD(P)/FAD-dependent oxidoreductase [Desulfobacterota bacterium AH_259_B03_O07]
MLADSGLSVALFERDSEIGKDIVCSGVISKEAFSRYDLPHEAIVGRLKEADLFSPGGCCITYSHPEEAVFVVDRHIFDRKLAENALDRGAKIFLNTKISSLSVEDKYVMAHIKTQEGEHNVFADICVIATGANYNLQSSLGLGRPKKIIKGIQVEIKTEDIERLRLYWGRRFSNGFFGWAIPLMDGRTRVGVMTEGNAIDGLRNTLSAIGDSIDSSSELSKARRRGIAFGTITRSYSDRIIVVGEAAGHIKTTTGGGIYYGLLSAEIASKVIKKAFKVGTFEAKTISKYEKQWKKILGKEIAFGEYFHKFYSKLSDNSLDGLFSAAKQDALLSYIAKNGKFDWHKDAIVKIIKSPNLRKALWNGFFCY